MRDCVMGVLFICLGLCQSVNADEPSRSITVDARSELRVAPDEAVLDFTIETRHDSVVEAKAANDLQSIQVAQAMKSIKLSGDSFRVTDFTIGPWYEGRPARLVGYRVARSFQIRTGEFVKIEPAISAIIDATGDSVEIDELQFRVRDQRKHQTEARRLAMEYARQKAKHLAELNGMILGAPSKISEAVEYSDGSNDSFGGFGGGGFSVNDSRSPAFRFASQQVTSVQDVKAVKNDVTTGITDDERKLLLSPGQVSLNATVNVTFDLVPDRVTKEK